MTTPEAAYAEQLQNVLDLLQRTQGAIARHGAGKAIGWPHVSSMAAASMRLVEVLGVLGDLSEEEQIRHGY